MSIIGDSEVACVSGIFFKKRNKIVKGLIMKQIFRAITLLAAIGVPVVGSAQVVVWSENFDELALGPYGAHTQDFAGGASPANNIVSPGYGGSGNAMAFTFNAVSGTTVNIQTATLATAPIISLTDANLSDYTLSFEMAIQGVDITTGYGGLQISVQGNNGGIFGAAAVSPFIVPVAGTANSGYQLYSYNLGAPWTANGGGLIMPSAASLAFGIGVVAYGNGMTASPETLLVDNVQISMIPEPSSIVLCSLGLAMGIALIRRRQA